MNIRVRDTKGITLVALVITIVVILILASVVTYSGIDAVNTAKKNRFIAEMKIMQTEVNDLYDKYKNGGKVGNYEGSDILNIGKNITEAQDKVNIVFKSDASGITNTEGYRYFDTEIIQKLGIEDIQEEFFVNIAKRSIVSVNGLEYNDKTCYTLAQLNILYNVEYKENTQTLNFNVKSDLIGENKYKITIEPIYSGNIQKCEVKYQLDGDTYWNTSDELTFNVEKAGKYNIKIQNGDIESEIKSEYIGYVAEGMVLHYDGIINTRNGSNKSAEINTWEDLSGNRNDGALKNSPTWQDDSLKFDGTDDYVLVGKFNYDNITLEVVASNDNIDSVESEYISNYESGGYGLSYRKNKNLIQVYTKSSEYTGYKSQSTSSDIIAGKKYSLSGSFDSTKIILFQNGEKYNLPWSGTINHAASNTALCLGTNPSGDLGKEDWLNGKIYSVRVYNRALTDEEVKINYEIDKTRFNIQ